MANGGTPAPTGAPWVDQLARVVATVGFPVVAAGLLLWFVLTRFAVSVEAVDNRMLANANAIDALTERQASTLDELKRQTVLLEQILRRCEPHELPRP
jgi:hypothetical protein